MITADQLVAHAVGDYILQSDWMATEKTKKSVAAAAHALTYTIPFLFLSRSPAALAFIVATHFIIDRWRLARYVVWAKNWVGTGHFENVTVPLERQVYMPVNLPWSECKATGYKPSVPPWMAVWLLIIADNTLHVLCNALALRYLG